MKISNAFKALSLAAMMATGGAAFADNDNGNRKLDPTSAEAPIGFDQMLVYFGTGLMDYSIDEPRIGHTGCTYGTFCHNLYFQTEIMHRSPAEIAALEQSAKDFFAARFGINVDDYVTAGLIDFFPWTLHPDLDYRTYIARGPFAPGLYPPAEGWEIRDGGWAAAVSNPDGLVLGGEFDGQWVPMGAMVLKGNYNILATDTKGRPKKEIVIDYRSVLPIIPRDDGSFLFRCELNARDIPGDSWDEGFVFGHMANTPLPDGRVKGNGRNVVSFPKFSDVDNILDLLPEDIRAYREARAKRLYGHH